jgi:hypothetical protein
MKINVNFGEVKGIEPFPEGDYEGIIERAYAADGRSEHPQIKWEITCLSEGDQKGRTAFMSTSFSPGALWKMKEIFGNFGLDMSGSLDVEFDKDTSDLTYPDLIGKPVGFKCGKPSKAESGDRMFTNVTSVYPAGGAAGTPANKKAGVR